MVTAVDVALLSCMGVNGRAHAHLFQGAALRELLEASALRARKTLTEDELRIKREEAERFRGPLHEFIRRTGAIVGSGGAHELGSLMRAPVPPLCAYLRGDPSKLVAPIKVAIVGTRHPSTRGIERASEIASALSKAGVLIVSGGAIGIDMAAHKGAVDSGHSTLAILGEVLKPLGDERPERLRALGSNQVTSVTLFGPWVRPSKSLFVIRNQYVAALADAVIIVEGRPNSGTLHTARYANRMQVPVWVVPGDPSDEMAQAGNWLLEQGMARALVRLEYFLSTLKVKIPKVTPAAQELPLKPAPSAPVISLSTLQSELVGRLRENQGRMTVDELAEKCEASVSVLQQELLMLQLMGAVQKQGTEFVIT